jgi:hypothetical protein
MRAGRQDDQTVENIMRAFLLAAAGATAILTAGPLATRSEAMPIGPSLRPAAEAVSPVQKAGCYRWGRLGWGWCPWCGYAWGPRYYWGPRHYWGPRVWAWRWHHRHWH